MFFLGNNSIPVPQMKATKTMEEETQHALRPRPLRRAKKGQIVQSSPGTREQVVDIIRVATPGVRKPTKQTKPPEPAPSKTQLQPPFLSEKESFDFSLPARDKPSPFTIFPRYQKIMAPELSVELGPQANSRYQIMYDACALLGDKIKKIDEDPESPMGDREKHLLVKAVG